MLPNRGERLLVKRLIAAIVWRSAPTLGVEVEQTRGNEASGGLRFMVQPNELIEKGR